MAEKNREIAQHFYSKAVAGAMSMDEAKRRTRDVMLSQTIGKTGYIYCIDSHGVILIHPENALVRVDLSDYSFIADQKIRKVGYLEYNWRESGRNPSEAQSPVYDLFRAVGLDHFGFFLPQ